VLTIGSTPAPDPSKRQTVSEASLTEEQALEVFAYLVSAARTQLDEAAEYAPLRMLTAAQRLGGHLREEASPPVLRLLEALDSVPPTATPSADPAAYTTWLDGICVVLADTLLAAHP